MILIKLKHKVVIEEMKPNPDEFGIKEWVKRSVLYAKIESLFNHRQIGNEIAIAKRLVSSNYYKFTVRYSPKITSEMRILYDSEVYNIIKVIHDLDKRKYTSIVAEEVYY